MTEAYRIVQKARDTNRLTCLEIIEGITEFFVECHGDRLATDDPSILGGVGMINNLPISIIGMQKGHTLKENMYRNFGSSGPGGYRKVQRLMKQAEKFGRPVLTIVNTPGAFCSPEAEDGGIGESVASCLTLMSDLKVPIIALMTGEGGSGGALALSVANKVWMFKHSIYSILSPEGFASILWKDAKKSKEAAEVMRLTPNDLYEDKIIDEIISDDIDTNILLSNVKEKVYQTFEKYQKWDPSEIVNERFDRFRKY